MPTIISGDNGIDKVANGAVDLTTDVTGILPTANGGTASSSGALPSQTGNSGKYLTTDGTNSSWGTVSGGVTSLNGQTGAITNTDYGAIGSYTVAYGAAGTAYSKGSTIAGSSLTYATDTGQNYGGFSTKQGQLNNSINSVYAQNAGVFNSMSLSGTWRCVSFGGSAPAATYRQFHLWVRIS